MELEEMLRNLYEMKTEYRQKLKAFNASVKTLRETIKAYENLVTNEVIRGKETVTVGNIRAEYKPTVIIKIKKEKEDGKQ